MPGRLAAPACLFLLLLAAPASAQESVFATSSAGHVAIKTGDGVRVAGPDGRFGPVEPVKADALAVGSRGDAVAVWSEYGDTPGFFAAYRPPGGPFGPPKRLDDEPSGGGESLPVAGVDGSGTVIVGWTHGRRDSLVVAMRDPQTGWRPEQPLGGRSVFRPKLVVSSGGMATLAWRQAIRRNVNEHAVATRAPGAATFGRPSVVTRKGDDPGDGPELAANERGDAAIVWNVQPDDVRAEGTTPGPGEDDGSYAVGVFRRADGRFGARRRLSPRQGDFPSAAVRPDGGIVIAWANNGLTASARLRTPSGSLRPVYRLTRDHEQNTAVVALAHGTGAVAYLHREPPWSLLRVARLGPGGRPGKARTIARARDAFDLGEPLAFLASPRGLFFVEPDARNPAARPRLKRVR